MDDSEQQARSEDFLKNYTKISKPSITEEEIIELVSEKPDLGLVLKKDQWTSLLSSKALHTIFDRIHENNKPMYNGILQQVLSREDLDINLMNKIFVRYQNKQVVVTALLRRQDLPAEYLNEIAQNHTSQILAVAMHPNLDDALAETLWFQLQDKHNLLVMAPKVPLQHALNFITENKEVPWDTFKEIQRNRPQWAKELKNNLQKHVTEESLNYVPVEWLENLFFTLVIE